MAFDLSKLSEQVLTTKVKYAGTSFTIEYYAGEKAKELEDRVIRLQNASDEENQGFNEDGGREWIVEGLAEVLHSWEIENEGKTVPLEASAMYALPVPTTFFVRISQTINEELGSGGGTQKKAFGSGSSRAASKAS